MQGIRGEQRKAIRIEGICKSSQKVCFLSRLVSDGREDRQVAALLLYRLIVTFLSMKLSTGLRSTPLSSASISQAKEKPSPSILPISPSPVIRHLGLVTSGQAVPGIISED